MKSFAKTLSLSLVGLMMTASAAVWAENIGVVDTQVVTQQYTKAQTASAEVRTREQDLQKYKDNLLKQLKAGEKLSPVEKKNLEDKLNNQFAERFKTFREYVVSQENIIKQDLDQAIRQISAAQKIDVVLPKTVVMQGGRDITQDVIDQLNKSAPAATK